MADSYLRERLIQDEGLVLTAYKDSLGYWTIGVGHLLGDAPRMSQITRDEAMALLDLDVQLATELALKFMGSPRVPLDRVRWAALVNMAFNLGNKLGLFKQFLVALRAGDWPTAATEMMDSAWSKQVGDRAVRLRDDILKGDA